MSINRLMNLGTRSLQANQLALQTAGHNISNANTEGYSRQNVRMVASPPFGYGDLVLGDGSNIANIRRAHDEFLAKQINKEAENYGAYQEKSSLMDAVESVFNESVNEGFNSSIARFFNDMRKLTNNPESFSLRTAVVESGKNLVASINKAGTGLEKVQRNIDARIGTTVQDINSMVKEIANLNKNIAKLEVGGKADASDLRDRRDLLLKQISTAVDVQYSEDERGMVSINFAGSGALVVGVDYKELELIHSEGSTSGPGLVRITLKGDKSNFDLTDSIRRGSLAGMLDVRDKVVPEIRNKMEYLVYNLANRVNEEHSRGFDLDGNRGGAFFDSVESRKGILKDLKLSQELIDSPRSFAAASRPFEPANNEAALNIAAIQRERNLRPGMEEATLSDLEMLDQNSVATTIGDYYGSVVGSVGIITKESRTMMENQRNVLDQLNNFRDSMCGVSIDEEGVDLIKYQRAFEASARMIVVADELLQTVMNLKRI